MDARGQRQPKRWTQDEDSILYEEAIKQGTSLHSPITIRRHVSLPTCGRWLSSAATASLRPRDGAGDGSYCTCLLELTRRIAATASIGPVKDWHRIAAKIPNRTNKDCRKRWINKVRGGLRSGPWSEAEDQMLRDAVEKYGQRWTVISQEFGSRSSDQCAKRWQYTLDPKLEHREWTSGEDHLLLELVQKFGHDWKFICYQHYPTRSRNDVKNRYTILSRRLSSGAAGTDGADGADEDFQDYTYMGGVEGLLDAPNPLDASELGDKSSTALGIALPEAFEFNLFDDPACEDTATNGSIGSPFPDANSNYHATSTGGFGETDEPNWFLPNMDIHAEAAPSPYTKAPGDGSHGEQCGSADMDMSQALASLDCPSGFIECIENLDGSSASVFPGADGDCDPRSPSFKVVLMADKCDHELVKYLIDVTKPIQGRVKMKVVM